MSLIEWYTIAMQALCLFLGLPILFVWLLFGFAWLKGWSRPDITTAEIMERMWGKKP